MFQSLFNKSNLVTVNTSHKLSREEKSILQQLIGKSLTAILCSGANMYLGHPTYNFTDTVNLRFESDSGYISISAKFDETNFGDDFISIFIKKEKIAIGIPKHESGGLQHPFLDINVYPEFRISKIEVYGLSYTCHSDNDTEKPFWKIEIDNPGKPITENIETENVIVLYSDENRITINTFGPLPWIQVAFESNRNNDNFIDKDNEGNTISKLKYVWP